MIVRSDTATPRPYDIAFHELRIRFRLLSWRD